MRAFRFSIVVGMSAILAQSSIAQQYVARSAAPLAATALNRLGLERAWQTHVAVDSSRGKLTFVTLHISHSQWTTIIDVKYSDGTKSFDERQLDSFGRPIGIERARFLADVEQRVQTSKGVEASVAERRVPSITLYAQTDRGVLHAIDAETGRTKWSYSAGSASYPSLAPGANDHFVATINGSTLYVFNVDEEKLAWQKRLGSAPGAGPALTGDTVYVPLLDGMVRGFSLDTGDTVAQLRSIGRPMEQPVVAGSSLTWPTDRGYLYVMDFATNALRFRLETNAEILGNAAFMELSQLITTTSDGHAYAVNQVTGDMLWQFSVGDTIKTSPIVFGNRAYIVSAMGELNSIDGDTGIQQWYTPHVRRIVAGNNDRLFAIGLGGELMSLDRESGAVLGQVTTGYDLHVPNSISDRIYLGNSHGALVCLRAAGQTEPILHVPIPELVVPGNEDAPATDGSGPPQTSPATDASPGDDALPFDTLPSDGISPFDREDEPLTDEPLTDEPLTDEPPTEDGVANPFDDGGADPFGDAPSTDEQPSADEPSADEPSAEPDPFGDAGDADPFG